MEGAWIKGNKVEISIVLAVTFMVGVVATTLTYADREGAQDRQINLMEQQARRNSEDICELTDMLKEHVKSAQAAVEGTIKMKSDVEHIKSDIQEIKTILRNGHTTQPDK